MDGCGNPTQSDLIRPITFKPLQMTGWTPGCGIAPIINLASGNIFISKDAPAADTGKVGDIYFVIPPGGKVVIYTKSDGGWGITTELDTGCVFPVGDQFQIRTKDCTGEMTCGFNEYVPSAQPKKYLVQHTGGQINGCSHCSGSNIGDGTKHTFEGSTVYDPNTGCSVVNTQTEKTYPGDLTPCGASVFPDSTVPVANPWAPSIAGLSGLTHDVSAQENIYTGNGICQPGNYVLTGVALATLSDACPLGNIVCGDYGPWKPTELVPTGTEWLHDFVYGYSEAQYKIEVSGLQPVTPYTSVVVFDVDGVPSITDTVGGTTDGDGNLVIVGNFPTIETNGTILAHPGPC